MHKKKLIIFDLDGTLYKLKGGSFINSKLNKKITKNAINYIQIKLHKNKKEAINIFKKIKINYKENISIALEREYKLNRYDYFNYVWNIKPTDYIEKYNELTKILDRLSKNYKFLLISDAPSIWINNVLKELKANIFFNDNILTGDGNKRKIFNNRFNNIAVKHKIKPNQIVVIGDQENSDIKPALKAGFKTIYINDKNKSKYADLNINNIKHLESAIMSLFECFKKDKYYKYAINNLKIKKPSAVTILSGSSDSLVLKYKKNLYKLGPKKEIEEEVYVYKNFQKVLGKEYKNIFPKFKIINQNKKISLYKIEFIGEYNLEDYLLNPKLTNKTLINQINQSVLKNIDKIFCKSISHNKNDMEKIFQEIIHATIKNSNEAGLLNLENTCFLNKLKNKKNIFIKNCKASLSHKDLTAVNIIIGKDKKSAYFIDPRKSLPRLNKSLANGNIGVDLSGYYITILRKEMEHNKLFKNNLFNNIKKNINHKIKFYINKKIINQEFIDLCMFYWYSVYLACNCKYCMSIDKKWLYFKMKEGYYVYQKKIKMHINTKTL